MALSRQSNRIKKRTPRRIERVRRERTGAELLLGCILSQKIEVGFGVPGESYLALLDALYDVPDSRFRFVTARHEGGAGFMALGYSKLTNRPGLCFVTRGPGATNVSIAVHTARQDSAPLIVFVGQVSTEMRGREAFQEIDYVSMYRDVAKWVVEIDSADRIPEIMSRVFSVSMNDRPGPVVVSLPENILTSLTSISACPRIEPIVVSPDVSVLGEIMTDMNKSEKPVVVVGGGGWTDEGRASLRRFVEKNKLGVIVAFRNQDLLDNGSPSYCGEAGFGMPDRVRDFLDSSDFVLAINVRFGEVLTDGYTLFDPTKFNKRLAHIHVSHSEIDKIFVSDYSVISDPNRAVAELSQFGTSKKSPKNPIWANRTKRGHSGYLKSLKAPLQPGLVDMSKIMKFLDESLPNDTIVTNGAGNFAIWPGRHLRYRGGMRLLGPQAGSMGAGIPFAIAAKLLHPNRLVLCFAGDGDFQMTGMELGTARQYGAKPVILVLNNGMYGTIRLHQERAYPGRVSGTDILNPDFVQLAESFGFLGYRVSHTSEFYDVFGRVISDGGLIELMIDSTGLSPTMTLTKLRSG